MREILFRGFHPDENGKERIAIDNKTIPGEWVEGFIYEHLPPLQCITTNDNEREKSQWCIAKTGFADWNMLRPVELKPVIYETVSEFTGLTDKNGKKIFENDIVHSVANWDNANMVIMFEKGEFKQILCEKYKSYLPMCGYYNINNFYKEVIGNIFNNPELLEPIL